MNRREETAVVKKALVTAGFDKGVVRVRHGTGTAWGWLNVEVDMPSNMNYETCYTTAVCVTQKATGRHGAYGGDINVTVRR